MENVFSLKDLILREAGFPGLTEEYCGRPHVCDEIIRTLQGDTEVVFLEARPGFGATNFTAELALRFDGPVVLLHIKTGSRLGYSATFLMESAVAQAKLHLGIKEGHTKGDIGQQWRVLFAKLQRLARSRGRFLYIVVDGLHQIPESDLRYANEIVRDVLALSLSGVKHVIVEHGGKQYPTIYPRTKSKPFSLLPLSRAETLEFLQKSGVTADQASEIFQATRGVPGLVASALRLHRGEKKDLGDLKPELHVYYEAEWELLCSGDEEFEPKLKWALAVIAFSKRMLSIEDVVNFGGISQTVLETAVASESFLRIPDQSQLIEFASNSHRDFVVSKVQEHKEAITAGFIDKLLEDPNGKDAIQLLPSFFEEASKQQELISYLGPENLDLYLSHTESLTAVRRRTELGLRTARSVRSDPEIFRFSLKTSIVRGLDGQDAEEAHLAALAELGHFEEAFELAQSASTKESRLALLAILANVTHRRGRTIEPSIADRISEYVEQTSLYLDRKRTLRIAEYLVGPFPDLAIGLVEKASSGASEYQDLAITHLVLSERARTEGPINFSYVDRISDERIQKVLTASQALFGNKTPAEIKTVTVALESKPRAFLLRQWLELNSKSSGAVEIATYALDEISKDTSYIPSADDLRIFAEPIRYSQEKEKAEALYSRISALKAALNEAASTVDRLRLDLTLASAGVVHSFVDPEDILTELYLRAADIEDQGTRLECFTWLLARVDSIDSNRSVEEKTPFRALFKDGLHASLSETLDHTADHVDVLRGVLTAAAAFDIPFGISMIAELNTLERRDEGYGILLDRYLTKPSGPIEVDHVFACLDAIASPRLAAGMFQRTLQRLTRKTVTINGDLNRLIARAFDVGDSGARCSAISWAVQVDHIHNGDRNIQKLRERFTVSLDSVDRSWTRSKIAYRFVESIAKGDRSLGEEVYRELHERLKTYEAFNLPYVQTLYHTTKLAVFAIEGLFLRRLESEEHIARLFSLIRSVPSMQFKVNLYVEWAWRAYFHDRAAIVKQICTEGIVPLLEQVPKDEPLLRQVIVSEVFPLLFLWNSSYARQLLTDMEEKLRAQAVNLAIHAIVTKRCPSEPFADSTYRGCRVKYEEATQLLELVELLAVDCDVVGVIESVCGAITSKASIHEIAKHQRSLIAERLEKLIAKKLPDQNNIKHDGWKIVAQGHVNNLREWTNASADSAVRAALAIPNTSDRVFVLGILANLIPAKFDQQRELASTTAQAELSKIPSSLDQVMRRVSLSSALSEIRRPVAEALLRKALKDSLIVRDTQAAGSARRRIVDAAYQLSPDFAKELISDIDDDPARQKAKSELEDRLETHESKQSVLRGEATAFNGEKAGELGNACWKALGSLNAGKAPALPPESIRELVIAAAAAPLTDVWTCYAWALRSLQIKLQYTNEGNRVLLPIFEVILVAAEVASRIGQRVCKARRLGQPDVRNETATMLIGPMERESALSFIDRWFVGIGGVDVLICDPYFQPDDLAVLKNLSFVDSGKRYTVLTCHKEKDALHDLKGACISKWRELADTEPPDIRIIRVTYDGDVRKGPIHDRWILGDEAGLKLGTSIGSLGRSKLSELTELDRDQAAATLAHLTPFILNRERWLDGKKLRYEIVDL